MIKDKKKMWYFLPVDHSMGRPLSCNGPLHFAKRICGNIHSFIFLLVSWGLNDHNIITESHR